jgi:hypothetical protein
MKVAWGLNAEVVAIMTHLHVPIAVYIQATPFHLVIRPLT